LKIIGTMFVSVLCSNIW